MYEQRFLQYAIELSAKALDMPGTEPFAAVVVRDGRIVGEGIKLSRQKFDPTSRGETEAIRNACSALKTVDLRDCDLYSSCEPCALCVAAMHLSRIRALCYAAGLGESNAVLAGVPQDTRFTVGAEFLRDECGKSVEARSMPARQALSEQAIDAIAAWAKQVS